MVMRPYQVYAVEALIRQAALTNRNAYIWHTTGAGKTLTSFKTAQILAANPNIKKVIFLVDRKDLDSQTTEEFNKFEAGSVDVTDRTDILVRQMKDKNRQLIVTTMQKMANAVKRPQYEKIMDAYRDEKVVFIIDECHRSQFGDMHKDIVRHFKKAQFFGFTGTPRFEVNGKTEGKITQTTEMLFGECLHNYLIKDAIFDNNVLGFHIEYIKTMEGDFDWDDPTLADAIDVGELYMSDERMSLIANHIVQNHKAKTRNGQYTAIFAVSSIEALVKYYDIFKKIKHDLNISGIFSYGQNEDAEGKDEHSRDVEWDTLYGQSLFLPSLPEQEKIANLLTLLSNRIEKQRQLIIALKKYKRGVSDYLFLQNSKMPIHCKWKQFSFGDVVEINPKTPPLPEQFIYIDLECVESGQLKSLNYINKNHAPSRAQRVLCRNDVLFQMVRPYQKNNYLYRDIFDVPVVASTGYAQIRCSECNPFFVYEQISSEQFSREAMMRSTGTGYPAINADGLAQIPFYVPTPEEQEKIGVFLSALGAKIAKESEILAAFDIIKKALMQQLFT